MATAIVSITKSEYEDLIRDSENLKGIIRYLESSKYTTTEDIKSFLGIKECEE